MFRYRLKELLAEKAFREGRVVTIGEVAVATGVHRMTLSRLANHKDANPSASVLDALCDYFGCPVGQLMEHIPSDRSKD